MGPGHVPSPVCCFLHKAMLYLVTVSPETFPRQSPCRGESFK